MEILAYGIPTVILLAVLIYAVSRSGRLSRAEKQRTDQATREVQRQEDPQK